MKWPNLARSIRKRAVRLQSFPQLAVHDGATFLLDPNNWIDNRILAEVPYEPEQFAKAAALIAAHRITDFIDIGANFGLYAIKFARAPGVQRVVAFEPVRRNFNQLCANIFANGLDAKVTPHPFGLGKTRADAVIHIDPRSTGVSRLDLETTTRKTNVFTQAETIEIHRGDDHLVFDGRSIFAKIDVEGAALDVLMGLERFLARNTGALQVEVTEGESGVADWLEARGWTAQGSIGADGYFVRG